MPADQEDKLELAELVGYYLAQSRHSHPSQSGGGASVDFYGQLLTDFPLLACLIDDERVFAQPFDTADSTHGQRLPDIRAMEEYLKTHFERILASIPLEALQSVIDSRRHDVIAERFVSLGELRGLSMSSARAVSASYKSMLTGRSGTEVEHFVCLIAKLIGCERVKQEEADYYFRAASLVPNREVTVKFVPFMSVGDVNRYDHDLETALRETYEVTVVIILGETNVSSRWLASSFDSHRPVLLDSALLKSIALAGAPASVFRSAFLKSLPLKSLSPYQFNGPVTGETFTGRTAEIREVLDSQRGNYSIVGARRIGKTSLLKAVKRAVNARGSQSDTAAVYLDLTNATTIDRVRWELCQETWNVIEDDRVFDSDISLDEFGRILKRAGKQFLFLVDEVDDLLQGPDRIQFEAFMRNLSNGDYARFVLCGYRTLRDRVTDRTSHIHNLCDVLHVGPLNRHEAMDLVTRPMERLGVTIESDVVVESVLDHASTVPWLLQFFCDQLLQRLDAHNKRHIDATDVDFVAASDAFSWLLTDLIDRDSAMPVLERIIVHIHVASEEDVLSEEAIAQRVDRVLPYVAFTELRNALDYLTETYVFTRVKDAYRFFIPQIKMHYQRREQDIDYVLRSLAKQYRCEK